MALLVRNALSVRTSGGDKVSLEASVAEQRRAPSSLPPWLIFFFIPFHRLVPVPVAAEQRILLPAPALPVSSDRGEVHSSRRGNAPSTVTFTESSLAGRQRQQQPRLLLR